MLTQFHDRVIKDLSAADFCVFTFSPFRAIGLDGWMNFNRSTHPCYWLGNSSLKLMNVVITTPNQHKWATSQGFVMDGGEKRKWMDGRRGWAVLPLTVTPAVSISPHNAPSWLAAFWVEELEEMHWLKQEIAAQSQRHTKLPVLPIDWQLKVVLAAEKPRTASPTFARKTEIILLE